MTNTTWSNIDINKFDTLKENIKTDNLVIGGGICGILCAYQLKQKGQNVVLVEKNNIANERTNKTTATITALQDIMYKDLNIKKRRLYYASCIEALNEYKKLNVKYNFDFEIVSSYKYFNDIEIFSEEYKAIKEIGYIPQIYNYNGYKVLEFKNQAQMNPMLLIKELVKELTIYENTEIIKIDKNIAYTKNNTIEFKNVIIATGYPFMKIKGLFFTKLYQNKSYVIEIENNNIFKYNAIGSNIGDIYTRTYNNSLLIGASDQRTGNNKGGFKPIIELIKNKYNNNKIINKWINQDCMTLDNIPYIGRLKDNVFVACGFNMWGMTGSMTASTLIRDLILGVNNKYEVLFSPKRKLPIIKYMENIFTAIINLLTPKLKRCNHLGCALRYIEEENVYECPCHGSKYTKDGNVIYNPANKKINK